jgi:hypothetical protein
MFCCPCRPDTDSEDEAVVGGPLGQLRGVEESSDSDSDLMPQLRYLEVKHTLLRLRGRHRYSKNVTALHFIAFGLFSGQRY